ncbi:MAG: sigma-70 family RNA polymerase sigma factor [Gemmatimonadota bacterium]|nr:sigma-70 family RNA polymerase sigma factor [Gemmatimonadota bacterium]
MAQHHRERFEALILPHLDDAYTLARYLLRNEHDAQDVVQDAALRAFRYFDRYRDGDPRAWFLAIVRNCCFTWRRRHRSDRLTISFDDEVAPALEGSTATDALAIAQSDRAALERAVGSLPIEFREVVVLREVQGMSYSQIAAVIGVPIGTVMSRLSRARMRLAAALGAGAKEAS